MKYLKEMLQNRKTSIANIFRNRHQLLTRSNLDDDIYDRWHNATKEHENEGFQDLDESDLQQPLKSSENSYYYWIGKDYCNTYREDFKEVHEHHVDQFDRAEVPRMPWRDQGVVIFGESARDLARHFIQRWNHCKNEQIPYVDTYPYLLPKSYTSVNEGYREWFRDDLFKCNIQV